MSAPFLSHKSRNSCSRTYTSPRLCKLSDQKEPDHSLQWSQGFIIATSQHHTQTYYYLKPFSLVSIYIEEEDNDNRWWSSGVHGHSTMHATRHVLEAQCAFKVLMIPKSCNSHYVSHFAASFIVMGA